MARGLFPCRLPIFLCMSVLLTACGSRGSGSGGSTDGGSGGGNGGTPTPPSMPASVLATIPVAGATGRDGDCLAVNSTTNKIYVCRAGNSVTAITGTRVRRSTQ